jgi:GNAT superfamily N-acetyltransferase
MRPWHREAVEVRLLDARDERALAAWHAVLQASERDMWPDRTGFALRDVRAFALHAGTCRRFLQLAASEQGGPVLGVGVMECTMLDNRHAAEVTIAVHPAHRRRGCGTAIVEEMTRLAAAEGRTVLNSVVDLPVAVAGSHPSTPFARRVGFTATLQGNTRYLFVPLAAAKMDELQGIVASARDARDYRTLTFEAPWPSAHVDDHCELMRRMSTDEPAGDGAREEEVWNARRLAEDEELLRARGVWKLAAVAQHVQTGRLVAFSELLLAPDAPGEAWQMATLVHPEHRGHRLGLAVKLANLEALAAAAPLVRRIMTGNATVNAPMIAVNDLMGFEVVGSGHFWQKSV